MGCSARKPCASIPSRRGEIATLARTGRDDGGWTELTPKPAGLATYAGIYVALFGLFTVGFLSRAAGLPRARGGYALSLTTSAVDFCLVAALAVIAFRFEGLRPAQLGLKPVRWTVVPVGIGLGLLTMVASYAVVLVLYKAGLSMRRGDHGVRLLLALPLGLRVLDVLTAGIAEEVLYRAYPIARLGAVLGNERLAALVALLVFSAGHVLFWGWIQFFGAFTAGGVLTIIYLWRRNLVLNIIAHSTVDAIPLLLIPMFHH